jgi:hypothetical protein
MHSQIHDRHIFDGHLVHSNKNFNTSTDFVKPDPDRIRIGFMPRTPYAPYVPHIFHSPYIPYIPHVPSVPYVSYILHIPFILCIPYIHYIPSLYPTVHPRSIYSACMG